MKTICAFTAVCEEDAFWLPQYLREARRTGIPFVMHFDRCSEETKDLVKASQMCMGHTEQNRPEVEFDERHKQEPFDAVARLKFDWAMAWDVDETWMGNIRNVLVELVLLDVDWINFNWINLWENVSQHRADVWGHRDKMFNLQAGRQWKYCSPIVNGPKLLGSNGQPLNGGTHAQRRDVVCFHHGMMTHELRVQHKARWDRIYGRTIYNGNPYGFWNMMLDYDGHPPKIEPVPQEWL